MTWFAWRVQRLQFLVAAVAVAAFAIWLVTVGLHEQARWTFFTVHRCTTFGPNGPLGGVACEGFDPYNFTHWNPYFDGILDAIPGLVGLLFGAPLVARELEHGTNRFAWAQSITRTRWLVSKLLVGGSITAVAAGVLIALGYWWTRAVHSGPDILPRNFDITGFVVVSYALFAFMLGAALGTVLRRTGWAILVGIPLFGLFRFFVRYDLRSHLAPTVATAVAPNGTVGQAWPIEAGYLPIDRFSPPSGLTWNSWHDIVQTCFYRAFIKLPNGDSTLTDPAQATQRCATIHKLHYVVEYQPMDHYWLLQTTEAAIFIGVAILLLGVTVFAVRRWRT